MFINFKKTTPKKTLGKIFNGKKHLALIAAVFVATAPGSSFATELGFNFVGNADEKAKIRIQSQYLEKDINTLKNRGFTTEAQTYLGKLEDIRKAGASAAAITRINEFLNLVKNGAEPKTITRNVPAQKRTVQRCKGHRASHNEYWHSDARAFGYNKDQELKADRSISTKSVNVNVEQQIPIIGWFLFLLPAVMDYYIAWTYSHIDDAAGCNNKTDLELVDVAAWRDEEKLTNLANSLTNLKTVLQTHQTAAMEAKERADREAAQREQAAKTAREAAERDRLFEAQKLAEARAQTDKENTERRAQEAAERATKAAQDREAGRTTGINVNAAAW